MLWRCMPSIVALASCLIGTQGRFQQITLEKLRVENSARTRVADRQLEDIAKEQFQEATISWNSQNLLGAMELFLKSAQKGNEIGEYCFRQGQYAELPPSDFKQAVRWYMRGARFNHQACITMLGKLRMSMGLSSDADSTLKLTAAPNGIGGTTGDSLAQWFLAEMNLKTGKIRNAVKWWKRSAENGDMDAMMRLSQVFSTGSPGIPQEELRGQHWKFTAAVHGHQEALQQVPWGVDESNLTKVERAWMRALEDKGWL